MVLVVVPIVVEMLVVMIMIMVMIVGKQGRTGEVHQQPKHCDERSVREIDFHWVQQAQRRFEANPECNNSENERRREARKVADLACSKCEPRVADVALSEPGGCCSYCESACVGCHVKAVCEQGHGAGNEASRNLAHHHHCRQRDHPQRSARVAVVFRAKEIMVMGEIFTPEFRCHSYCSSTDVAGVFQQDAQADCYEAKAADDLDNGPEPRADRPPHEKARRCEGECGCANG